MNCLPCLVALGGWTAVSEPPRSVLPLITRLQQQYGVPAEAHSQRYRRLDTGAGTALTTENTDPIRFHLNFDSLYEDKAPPYSACFRVGDWYRRGLPTLTEPPTNGNPTCTRSGEEWQYTTDEGCWGLCGADDVITPAGRQMIIDVVTTVAAEFSVMLGLVPVEGELTFKRSMGSLQQAQLDRGYTPVEGCAVDCTTLSQVSVDDSYCNGGVQADAVISVTKPPVVPGVAGSGSHCATDNKRRPTWLVFAWLDEIASTPAEFDFDLEMKQHRGLVQHELLHTLGFGNSMFVDARDSSGARKGLLKLKTVTDVDGSSDEVWHFVKGRAYELAQSYYGCTNESMWQGLPLMGKPELGRGSHWDTRIMRDDVMSYGHRAAVSGLTLAALEDLGFYLANYSAANCVTWGYKQGCEYVTTRCGAASSDQSVVVTDRNQCNGDPYWEDHPQGIVNDNCAGGNNPCDTNVGAGFLFDGTQKVCNGQCVFPPSSDACTAAPDSDVTAAGDPTTLEALSEAYTQWIWLGALVLGAIMLAMFGRYMCCPPTGSQCIASTLAVNLILLGGVLAGVGVYARFYNYDFFADYVGYQSLYAIMGAGGGVAILALLSLVAMCRKSGCLLITIVVLIALIVLAELALVGFLVYWIWALQDVSEASKETLQGDGDGRWEGRFGEEALAEIENLMCRTYTLCCRDPRLALIASPTEVGSGGDFASGSSAFEATCYGNLESDASDFKTAIKDPSNSLFCPYVSGSTSSATPPDGICDALDTIVPDFSQSDCQTTFCEYGADGYFEFVNTMTDFIRTYATVIGGVGCFLILVEMVWLVNLYNLRAAYKKERDGAAVFVGRDARGGAMRKHSSQLRGSIGV